MIDVAAPSLGKPQSLRHRLARQRRINQLLQEAIQPTPGLVTNLGGLRIAARCHSADPQVHIGGDWYLATPLPDGDLVLAVGDVEGRGMRTVESMVGLRYTAASYAAAGEPPAMILSRLNTLLRHASGAISASAVIVRYRPSLGRLVWARAGHPPMLLSNHRRVVQLPHPRGPLLGMFTHPPYEQHSRHLRIGESIMLYTDGMIGRGTLEEGVRQLADRLVGVHDPAALLEQLDFHAAPGHDACALIARRTD
ncbi:hypothetical protein Rhe02_08620 [Rhizocola hellebori]|uniref:PPM-type phosphatase domain-containing protein n=1 Tax=Rhizocola hellebori TaxID=1392758 RepID=A0A8J3Q3Y3_9ACTN|nr:PP2C family protein-serine/threonine phosphatase [Rhizocola hellebori]GIH02795.1 hypothetical protein Rhe02_08620 [Rhizocola hellebori]